MPLARYSKPEFLERKFTYRPGTSAMIVGPTGGGKTKWATDLLHEARRQNPGLATHAMAPKPSDTTMDELSDSQSMPYTSTWPGHKKFLAPTPNGYVFNPRHIRGDEDANVLHLQKQFKGALNHVYWEGNSLTLIDDTYLVGSLYKCESDVVKFLVAGRSNHVGIIGCYQQPKGTAGNGVSSYTWSQPEHLLLMHDTSEDNRKKFGQIGMGLDPRMIDDVVKNLRTWPMGEGGNVSEVLYLHRGGYAAILSPW